MNNYFLALIKNLFVILLALPIFAFANEINLQMQPPIQSGTPTHPSAIKGNTEELTPGLPSTHPMPGKPGTEATGGQKTNEPTPGTSTTEKIPAKPANHPEETTAPAEH